MRGSIKPTEHVNLVYTRSDTVGNIIDGRGQAQCGIDKIQGRSLRTTSTRPMTPSCSSSPMVPMFAVDRGHENASEQVKIKTIPHIEFLDDRQYRQYRLGFIVKTIRM